MKKTPVRYLLLILPLLLMHIHCGSSGKLLAPGSPLISLMSQNPNLSAISALLQTPGLSKVMGSTLKKPFTLLAPNNNALDALGSNELTNLAKPENLSSLASMLKNHIFAGKLNAADLTSTNLKNAAGNTLNLRGIKLGNLLTSDKFNVIPVNKVLQ